MVDAHNASAAAAAAAANGVGHPAGGGGRANAASTASQSQHYYPPSVVVSPDGARAAAQNAMRMKQHPTASPLQLPGNGGERPTSVVSSTRSGVTHQLANMANKPSPVHPISAAGIAAATGRGSPGAPLPGSVGPTPSRQQQRRSPNGSIAGFARAEISLLKKIEGKSKEHPDCLGLKCVRSVVTVLSLSFAFWWPSSFPILPSRTWQCTPGFVDVCVCLHCTFVYHEILYIYIYIF